MRIMNSRAARQRGMSLLEALLAMAIATLMLGALVHLLSESQTEMRAKNTAEHIQAFQRVAAQYYQSNRKQLLDAMDGDNNGEADLYCRVNVRPDGSEGDAAFDLDRHICVIDASLLQARKLLPGGMNLKTPHGEKLVAIFRRTYDEENLPTNNVEMVVLTVLDSGASHAPDKKRFLESLAVASHLGAVGGTLPDGDRGKCRVDSGAGIYEICGNGWKLKLDDFISAEQLSAFQGLLR